MEYILQYLMNSNALLARKPVSLDIIIPIARNHYLSLTRENLMATNTDQDKIIGVAIDATTAGANQAIVVLRDNPNDTFRINDGGFLEADNTGTIKWGYNYGFAAAPVDPIVYYGLNQVQRNIDPNNTLKIVLVDGDLLITEVDINGIEIPRILIKSAHINSFITRGKSDFSWKEIEALNAVQLQQEAVAQKNKMAMQLSDTISKNNELQKEILNLQSKLLDAQRELVEAQAKIVKRQQELSVLELLDD